MTDLLSNNDVYDINIYFNQKKMSHFFNKTFPFFIRKAARKKIIWLQTKSVLAID